MDNDSLQKQPSSGYETEFLNSISSGVGSSSPKKPRRWLIPVIGGLALIIVILVIVLVNLSGDSGDMGGSMAQEELADQGLEEMRVADEEVLNSEYAAAVKDSKYASYESALSYTSLINYGPSEICAMLKVSCASLAHPENLSNFTKVDTLNTNGVDYFLDSGRAVIIVARGGYPYSENGSALVVYAVNYYLGHTFTAFIPPEAGGASPLIEVSRGNVIDDVIGVPDFYVSNDAL